MKMYIEIEIGLSTTLSRGTKSLIIKLVINRKREWRPASRRYPSKSTLQTYDSQPGQPSCMTTSSCAAPCLRSADMSLDKSSGTPTDDSVVAFTTKANVSLAPTRKLGVRPRTRGKIP